VPTGDKAELRAKLGWPQDKFIALLVGGGDGMGPLGQTAYAIAQAELDVAVVVVTGRNAKLREQLDAQYWPIPAFIYGFTRDLPDFMRAADVIVTKAGPGTIAEALNAGLPIILYSKLPGQEDGNVDYVVDTETGVWAPKAHQVVATLREWIQNPARREQIAANCRKVARPDAAKLIAQAIAEKLGLPEHGV
jgi:1,2-diacylglycerol 3-beta-galactosyltransferase